MLRALLVFSLLSNSASAVAAEPEVFLSRPAPPSWWSRSGETWLALFGTGASKRFDLKSVQSKVYVDSRDSVIKLGAQNSPDPIFFLAGSKLRPGSVTPVEGLKFGTPLALSESTSLDFVYKKESWRLKRKTLTKKSGGIDFVIADVVYSLASAKKEIELGHDECHISIRFNQSTCEEKVVVTFAGDLDQDGLPDLFLLAAPERRGPESAQLYLTSLKKPVLVSDALELSSQTKPFQSVNRKTGKDEGLATKTPVLLITGRQVEVSKSAFTSESWFAFFNEQNKLEPVKIWVACQQGQCEESQRVEISKNESPLLLVRGIAGLKAGTIKEAATQALPADPDKDLGFTSFNIEFGGEKSRLVGGTGVYTLETPEKKTVFPIKTLDPDDKPKLVWAGDLNFDGKLDLYFEVKQDSGLAHLLYISPEAATGPIPGPTAKTCSGNCY